jgi:erythromycin esterase
MLRHTGIALVLTAAAAGCATPSRPASPESSWIAAHSAPLRSIDPSDRPYDDLGPVGGTIGPARIVLLGEQTHGEGSTFLAKTRLISYLHERLGFDVLAMESDMFACERAGDAIRAGRPAREMFEASVFNVWTGSAEFSPLIDYVERTRATTSPLELTGFDLQLSGRLSTDRLVKDLSRALPDPAAARRMLDVISTMTTSMTRFAKVTKPERDAFYAAAADAQVLLDARSDGDGRFLAQVLRSVVRNARFWWEADFAKPVPAIMNIRDAQMADNLLWLARERYPGRKIIVWAATSHASRNRQLIRPPISDAEMVPMGHRLWQELGRETYVVAFTSARGRFGSWRGSASDLALPRPGSLEDAFDRTGVEAAFLDLRASVHEGDWLASPVMARLMGHARMVARWPDIVDGIVFVKTARPSRPRE